MNNSSGWLCVPTMVYQPREGQTSLLLLFFFFSNHHLCMCSVRTTQKHKGIASHRTYQFCCHAI